MKNNIMNFVKVLVMTNVMIFGFFFIYAGLWLSLGLPTNAWTLMAVVILVILSMAGFFWWCGTGDKNKDKNEDTAECKESPEVVYICDGYGCDAHCKLTGAEHEYCKHTFDISHAANFKQVEPGKWMEVDSDV